MSGEKTEQLPAGLPDDRLGGPNDYIDFLRVQRGEPLPEGQVHPDPTPEEVPPEEGAG